MLGCVVMKVFGFGRCFGVVFGFVIVVVFVDCFSDGGCFGLLAFWVCVRLLWWVFVSLVWVW